MVEIEKVSFAVLCVDSDNGFELESELSLDIDLVQFLKKSSHFHTELSN